MIPGGASSAAFFTPATESIFAVKGLSTIPPRSVIPFIIPSIGSVSTRPDILPPIPWTRVGLLEITGGDARKSFSHFKKVFQTLPNHANAIAWTTLTYSFIGRAEETYQYLNKLFKVDPFFPFIDCIQPSLNILTGEFELAEKQSKQLGSDDFSRWTRAFALMYNRKYEEALTEFNNISEGSRSSYMFSGILLRIYAGLRKQKEVIHLIDDKFLLWAKKDFQYSLWVAEAFAMINDKSSALNWLENSINHGNINYPFFNEYDPFLENIRGEARFKKLMERVKYEWENFEV